METDLTLEDGYLVDEEVTQALDEFMTWMKELLTQGNPCSMLSQTFYENAEDELLASMDVDDFPQ